MNSEFYKVVMHVERALGGRDGWADATCRF